MKKVLAFLNKLKFWQTPKTDHEFYKKVIAEDLYKYNQVITGYENILKALLIVNAEDSVKISQYIMQSAHEFDSFLEMKEGYHIITIKPKKDDFSE